MNRIITILILIACFCSSSFSQSGNAVISDPYKGVTLKLPYSFDNLIVFTGVYSGQLNSENAKFYVTDPKLPLLFSEGHQGYQNTSPYLTYILNNYYPNVALPYNGSLTENKEGAAIQLAIWFFSNGLNANDCSGIGGENIYDITSRANSIIEDTKNNFWKITPVKEFFITIPKQSFLKGTPVTFKTEAYDDYGRPVEGLKSVISCTDGSLSGSEVITLSNGESGLVTVSPALNAMTSVVQARANLVKKIGTIFRHPANSYSKKLLIATPENNIKTVNKLFSWWYNADVELNLVADKDQASIGEVVTYTLTLTNKLMTSASNVRILDLLPEALKFKSASGNGTYNPETGIWDIGTLAGGEVVNINIKVEVLPDAPPKPDPGEAKKYNVYAIDKIKLKGSDTEGKMAADIIDVRNYNAGQKMPPHSGNIVEALTKLTFKEGKVQNGKAAYGSFVDTNHCNLADDGIHKESTLDKIAEENKQLACQSQLAGKIPNGMTKKEYNKITFEGTDAILNIFKVAGEDLDKASQMEFKVPNNSACLVNVSGDNYKMSNGFIAHPSIWDRICFNLEEATKVQIKHIDFIGSILAPKTDVDFPAGRITGTLMCKNVESSGEGCGQFNWLASSFWDLLTMKNAAFNSYSVKTYAIVKEASQYNAGSGPVKNHELIINGVTSVNENSLPEKFELIQNYPNPFNPSTEIEYSIPANNSGFTSDNSVLVTLKIFDALGRLTETPVNEYKAAGKYKFTWNATKYHSGVYYYELKAGKYQSVKKMIYMK